MAIRVAVDPDLGFDIVAAVGIRRDLQGEPAEGDAVVAADDTLIVLAQDVVDGGAEQRDKGGSLFARRFSEFGVERREVDLLKLAVGLGPGGDAVIGQFLDQAFLMGAERSFTAASGLG